MPHGGHDLDRAEVKVKISKKSKKKISGIFGIARTRKSLSDYFQPILTTFEKVMNLDIGVGGVEIKYLTDFFYNHDIAHF